MKSDTPFYALDRVVFTGAGGGSGTVVSVRESNDGPCYRVVWDDGQGDDIEFRQDELVRFETDAASQNSDDELIQTDALGLGLNHQGGVK